MPDETSLVRPGWSLQGSSNLSCGPGGEWEGEPPSCQPASCRLAPGQTNASLAGGRDWAGPWLPGQQAEWQCGPGLQLAGPHITTCLPTGAWHALPPTCHNVDCSKITKLANGVVFGMRTTDNGSEVNFSCDHGYYKVEPGAPLQCKLGGLWEGQGPLCSRAECPDLAPQPHTSVSVAARGETYARVFRCGPCYELRGAPDLLCGDDGSWVGHQPTCVLAFCPPGPARPRLLQPATPTRLGGSRQLSCPAGFSLAGPAWLTCLGTGEWEGEWPVCQPGECLVGPGPQHGDWSMQPGPLWSTVWSLGLASLYQPPGPGAVWVGDGVRVECDPGYEVAGQQVIQCGPAGLLSGPLPHCRKSHCPALRPGPHSYLVNRATYKVSSMVDLSCVCCPALWSY